MDQIATWTEQEREELFSQTVMRRDRRVRVPSQRNTESRQVTWPLCRCPSEDENAACALMPASTQPST